MASEKPADKLWQGRFTESMDSVVEALASVDYPDGMTGGLRRTTDVARALVEVMLGPALEALREEEDPSVLVKGEQPALITKP